MLNPLHNYIVWRILAHVSGSLDVFPFLFVAHPHDLFHENTSFKKHEQK